MLYAILAEESEDGLARRTAARDRHLARVRALMSEGRLVFAGPHPRIDSPDPGTAGFNGSLIIAEFESQEAAEEWVAQDPYTLEGVFSEVRVKPVLQVLP